MIYDYTHNYLKRRIREKPENQDMIGSDKHLDQRIPSVFCADTCWLQAKHICKCIHRAFLNPPEEREGIR